MQVLNTSDGEQYHLMPCFCTVGCGFIIVITHKMQSVMNLKSIVLSATLLLCTSFLFAQKAQDTVVIEPFYQEVLQQPIKFTMVLPFKAQVRKKEIQGGTVTSPLVYVITPKKTSMDMELSIHLSDVTTGFSVKFIEQASGEKIKIASSAVRAVRLHSNPEKNEGLYLLFLKEITVEGETRDLGLTVTGRQDNLEKYYAALLKAFESSRVSR